MKYYYLGHILEKYYDECRTGILKHRWDDDLTLWALDMLKLIIAARRCWRQLAALTGSGHTKLFERILMELHIADDPSVIDDDFVDNIL